MNDNKFQVKGFLVWGICALFFLYEFFLRTVLGTYQKDIMQDLSLNSFQFSFLSTAVFLLVYGIMQIPAGLIVDNIGIKKSLLIGCISCSLSCFGFASSQSFEVAVIFRIIMGFGASFGFLCLLMAVRDWMPLKYIGVFIGLSTFTGTIGPMIAAGPLSEILGSKETSISWSALFYLLGFIGLIISVISFLFAENNQQKKGSYTILYKSESISTSIKKLFYNPQPWLIALSSLCLYFSIEYLTENEGRSFLALKNISAESASYMITISWLGYAIGCPLLGFISDIIERRKIILQLSSLIALTATLLILYSTNKLYIQIAFFLLGISASGQTVGFALMAEQFKKQFVAVGFGLNNAMMTVVSAVIALIIGFMLDSAKTKGFLILEDYLFVFNILIALSVGAIILSTFYIKETYCKSIVNYTILKTKSNNSNEL